MENESIIEVQLSGIKEDVTKLQEDHDKTKERQDKLDTKIEKTLDRMQKYQDMNNEKFLQLSINNAQMLEMTKNVEKNTERTADIMEKMVEEDKETKASIDKKFAEVDDDISDLKSEIHTKINSIETTNISEDGESRISGKTWGTILIALFALMETMIKVVAPLLAPLITK